VSGPSITDRLKQSEVVQAVAVFLGASWVVLQVVDLLTERLGLPAWVFPVALILLAIGFAVVLATAWVQSRPATTEAEATGELPSDWEVAPADALASLRAGRLPHLNWARVAVGGVVALSLLFGGAGAYVLATGGRPALGPAEAGADEGAAGLAILPFSVNDAELETWEEGIVDLLAPGLDGVAGFRTIASRTVLARWNEADRADDVESLLRVAGATGARFAMIGGAVRLGGTVRLTADVYDLADGRKVAEGSSEGGGEEMLDLVDELGIDTVRDLIRATGAGGSDTRLPALRTTGSLAAARAFLEGEDHFRAGRFPQATSAYEEALAADSSFALPAARAYLSLLYVGDGEQQRAMERELLRRLDDLPARDRTLARLRLQISGDSVRSVAPAEQAVEMYPDDAEAWYMLGEVRYHEPGIAGAGREEAREAFERAVELAPGFVPYYYHTVEYAIGSADPEGVERLLSALEEAVPDDPLVAQYRLATLLLLGPLDQARERVRADFDAAWTAFRFLPFSTTLLPRLWSLVEVVPSQGDVRLTDLKSALAMAVGRQAEAFELMRSIPLGSGQRVSLARHHQDVLGELPGFDLDVEFDRSYCLAKDVPTQASCYEKAALRAVDASRWEEARRTIAEQDSVADMYAASEEEFERRASPIHRRIARTVEGYMLWKRGELPAALRAFEETRRLDWNAVTARWYLAELYVATGDVREAVDLFGSIDDSQTWSPFSRLRAAEVLEEMGDADGARAHYRDALAAWTEADADFGPAERARAGLARVGG
jgi:tetratricopeptide (TPR) repeat protein